MRAFQLIVPLALIASPAVAQTPSTPAPSTPPSTPAPAAPRAAPPETITVPPELTDPATAERLGRMMQALSKAFLNLPVGEIEAIAEGRPATRADRRRTIRELGRKDDPNFERNLERDLAASRVAMQASMKAFAAALPAMMQGLTAAAREMERATANLPSPNYPKQ